METICPSECAKTRFVTWQKISLFAAAVFLLFAVVSSTETYNFYVRYNPFAGNHDIFYYSLAALYLIICAHKLWLIILGVGSERTVKITSKEISYVKNWPKYTILLPLYREKNMFKQLKKAVDDLEYPKDKLQILLLLERDDTELVDYVKAQKLEKPWHTIVVPQGYPKTKGRALNFGLEKATGEYLVIYDAEDIPDKDQLKKAATAFQKLKDDVVCLQSRLNYYCPYHNLLTKWSTIDYTSWFDIYLPGVDASGAPVPLGGTSNHLKTKKITELGGWDPYNVTEDCDLGIRIARRGLKTHILDTTTLEEANTELMNWIKQRSRWVKGYIQTHLVHMRDPPKLLRELGPVNFIQLNLVVGGNYLILCLNPLSWAILAAWILNPARAMPENPLVKSAYVTLLFGNIFFTIVNAAAVARRRQLRLIIPALLSPIYWILMSVGALKGLAQFFLRPHFWEKTDHKLLLNTQVKD